jgi:hypothetical protein
MQEAGWDEDPLVLPPEDPDLERALRTAKGSSRLVMPLDWQCVSCGLWHSSAETRCGCGFVPQAESLPPPDAPGEAPPKSA